jgi:hypothetical protein
MQLAVLPIQIVPLLPYLYPASQHKMIFPGALMAIALFGPGCPVELLDLCLRQYPVVNSYVVQNTAES